MMATNPLNEEDVHKILDHVGRDLIPPALNALELKNDILAAWDFYRGYKRTTAKASRTAVRKSAKAIESQADKLFQVLRDSDPNVRSACAAISRHLGSDGQPFAQILSRLAELVEAAQFVARRHGGDASIREILSVTPTEWFLGHDLVWVYEKHFGRPATRDRDDVGLLQGPYIRFATCVAAVLEDPFTDETVSRAISVVRKRIPRLDSLD
jgi:hypothetical protein